MPNRIAQRIITAFNDEMGLSITADDFNHIADPHHDDVYAVRLTQVAIKRLDLDLYTERDYILHSDGELEAGEFSEWPPRSTATGGIY